MLLIILQGFFETLEIFGRNLRRNVDSFILCECLKDLECQEKRSQNFYLFRV